MSFHASFLTAMAEFRAEGRGGQGDDSMVGADLRKYGDTWTDPTVFAEYLTQVLADAEQEVAPVVTLWWADADEYLGRISIRPKDSDWVLSYGGHFGYDIRPSARRKGHATAMLRAGLPVAKGYGLQRALINCLPDNLGSRAVIEAVGGVAEGERDGVLRHWVNLLHLARPPNTLRPALLIRETLRYTDNVKWSAQVHAPCGTTQGRTTLRTGEALPTAHRASGLSVGLTIRKKCHVVPR